MFAEQCKMDNSPGDARGEVAEKEERYGLVRWHSLKVVPLSCVKEKTKIVLDHLPVRCKCEWGRLEHSVELVEVSGKRWARAMHACTCRTKASVCTVSARPRVCLSSRTVGLSPFRKSRVAQCSWAGGGHATAIYLVCTSHSNSKGVAFFCHSLRLVSSALFGY